MHVDNITYLVRTFAQRVSSVMLLKDGPSQDDRETLRRMAHEVIDALATRRDRQISSANAARSAEAARQRADEPFELWWRSSDKREVVFGWEELFRRTSLSMASLRSKFSTGKGQFTRVMWDDNGVADNVTISRVNYKRGTGRPKTERPADQTQFVKSQKPRVSRAKVRAAPVGGRMRR